MFCLPIVLGLCPAPYDQEFDGKCFWVSNFSTDFVEAMRYCDQIKGRLPFVQDGGLHAFLTGLRGGEDR